MRGAGNWWCARKPVEGAADPELFRGERFGNLRYVIPVPPGRYGVTLYFAEAWFGPGTPAGGGVGNRVFDILGNGVALRRGFDMFKEAHGAGRALTWSAHGLEPDAQGKLNICADAGSQLRLRECSRSAGRIEVTRSYPP